MAAKNFSSPLRVGYLVQIVTIASPRENQRVRDMQLPEDRYFSPEPSQKAVARQLYDMVRELPLVCPHGHVDPAMFSDPDYSFGTPTDLLLIPDHYVFRMLYSQGVTLEELGIPSVDGSPVATDHREIWQIFAENFFLFRGTPTGAWLRHELEDVFGITEKLSGDTGQDIYDAIAAKLASPEFRPRALFEKFGIEVLCTTDSAIDSLDHHQRICDSDWNGRILPTFRPDAVLNLDAPGWRESIDGLSERTGTEVGSYRALVAALENRRQFFRDMGATATDHGATTPYTEILSEGEADAIFQRALRSEASEDDARRFTGHMLTEMARMSTEDGLVMQLHSGSFRNHNRAVFRQFGADKGCDIPTATEYTRNLKPLLDRYGNIRELTLILFTLDETTYSRELAPLAGHYPAVKLGPPWWFHDSIEGMIRYREQVHETAGLYNTVGFNDDTRAFPSIPARHDVWRRVDANWLAGLVVRGVIDEEDAAAMVCDSAYGLAKRAYRLSE